MTLLPLFLDLSDKRVLLVGGGSVARDKALALKPAGCRIRAVAPAFSPAFLEALEGMEAERHARVFRPEDLDGVHLVVSATNDPVVNAAIAREARARGIWVNAVDDPASCDALFPSVLRRGPFVAALSTEGAFAGLSRVVREALEALVPEAAVPEFEALIRLRGEIKRNLPDPAARASRLRALVAEVQKTIHPAGGRP